MYFKIAINNVKKSFKDYTIYFLTLTLAICIFYSFNSLTAQHVMLDVTSTSSVEILHYALIMLSVFVSMILACLIVYANNFLIKKRKKELGIYMTLGMPRRKISNILILETVLVGLISLIAGLLLGILASQGLSLFTVQLLDVSMSHYQFVWSISAIQKTCLYFGIIFFVVMILNSRIILKYKLIDMLIAERKNERIKVKNKTVAVVIFVLSILIILSAYWLVNRIGLQPDNKFFWLSVFLGAIGTALCFFSLSGFILLVIQKNKKLYLKDLNIFITRQISSKINTNFMTMTTICLALVLTITILSTGVSYKNSMEAGVEKNTPFDVTIYGYRPESDNAIKEELKRLNFNFSEAEKYVYFNKYIVKSDLISEIINSGISNDVQEVLMNVEIDGLKAISLSDFNNIRKLQGESSIELGENEVLITSNIDGVQKAVGNFIKGKKEFKIDNESYKIHNEEVYKESFETKAKLTNELSIVVPDKVIVNSKLDSQYLNVNFDSKDKTELSKKYQQLVKSSAGSKDGSQVMFLYGDTKENIIAESREGITIILFLSTYVGVIFLISSATVLALQQLSEASDSKERYKSLKKIGASEKMINKAIFVQVLIYFIAPLSIALIHSAVGMKILKDFFIHFGKANLLVSSLATIGIFIVVYGAYFHITYLGSKNSAKEK